MPLSLGNIILLKEKGGMRKSFPRQVDKKSRGPQREGSGILKEEERTNFFSRLQSLGLYNNNVSCLSREGNGTPLSTLAWKIPWPEEPCRLQSMGLRRVGHD